MHQHFRSFASALAFVAGTFALAVWIDVPWLATVFAILSVFVALPLCILLYRDALRKARDTNDAGAVVLAALSFPLRLLGVASVIIGIGTLSWMMYNLIVERQPEFRPGSTKQVLALVVFVVYGCRWMLRPLDSPPTHGVITSRDSIPDPPDINRNVD